MKVCRGRACIFFGLRCLNLSLDIVLHWNGGAVHLIWWWQCIEKEYLLESSNTFQGC